MTRNIYALLVGIDEYVNPIPPLNGCVNDITAVKEYLQGRVATDGYHLNVRTLLNAEATRQAIIDGFQQHLSQATSEDVAFFYYAGHGSQENSPEEFWALEPDRMDETIVCYDSRQPGVWDLADKELTHLIAEVSAKNPHMTVIMDCCHSGSGTRDLEESVRKAPIDNRRRPLESFLLSQQTSRSLESSKLNSKYISFSACLDSELAKEYNGDGQQRGVFSYFLLDTLKKANGSLTYRDLFKHTKALVSSKVTAQSPQMEATIPEDLDQAFLGGAIAAHVPYFNVRHDNNYGWVLDGGAVHGIPQPTGNETTIFALFPFDSPTDQLQQLSTSLGVAHVVEVMPQLSKITMTGVELQPEMTFKAVVTSLPLPPKKVLIVGEAAGVELARTALKTSQSLYIQEVTTPDAEFKLIAREGKYLITRPVDDRPLVAQIPDYNTATATIAIQRLEHIARWTNIAELSSPATSRIQPSAVKIQIYQDGQELRDPEIRLEYRQENGKSKGPTFKVKLTNTSTEPLYCALLDLTDSYAVSAELLPTGGVWLQPAQEAWALGGEPIYPTISEALRKQGITEVKDLLKLIVSTAEFDATLLEQAELDLPSRAIGRTNPGGGTLNRLMTRIQSRALNAKPEEEVCDDWVTTQISIITVRPQATTAIPQNGNISLGSGVSLQSHPSLKANARLTSVSQSTRDLGSHLLPPILQGRAGVQPFSFTSSRGTDPGLSALELTEVEDASVVTPLDPLKLIVDLPLTANEQILPLSYDGEFYLPLGSARSTSDGKTEIILERLPEPVSEGKRSLGGSIRIFCHKVVANQFGLEYEYPILAVADVNTDGIATYTQEIDQVKERVAAADKIVLYIHGIIGDTQWMVGSVQRAKIEVDGQQQVLAKAYDLVLTFDYENLNTPIEENGKLLKQRLEAVGLGANHGKTLHIVAHSMGGLVSRWFIEQEGGNQVVQHLIMLGTPNAGSPWSTVSDWALTTLSIGLNGLSQVVWPTSVIGLLVKALGASAGMVKTIDIPLAQMHPGSEILQKLATSPDPGIPYSIIAGNTAIAASALKSTDNQPNLLERLHQKLFKKAVALPFFGQPNDIAVMVTSIKHISDLTRSAQIQEIGCDHLSYFSDPAGLTALSAAVMQTSTNSAPSILPQKSRWFPSGIVGALLIAMTGLLGFFVSSHTELQPQPPIQSAQK